MALFTMLALVQCEIELAYHRAQEQKALNNRQPLSDTGTHTSTKRCKCKVGNPGGAQWARSCRLLDILPFLDEPLWFELFRIAEPFL